MPALPLVGQVFGERLEPIVSRADIRVFMPHQPLLDSGSQVNPPDALAAFKGREGAGELLGVIVALIGSQINSVINAIRAKWRVPEEGE